MSMPSSEARTSLPAMTIQDGCTVRPEASTVNLEVESEPYSSTFVTGILRLLLARHPINFVISRLVKKYVFERNLNQKLSITSNTKSLYLKKKKRTFLAILTQSPTVHPKPAILLTTSHTLNNIHTPFQSNVLTFLLLNIFFSWISLHPAHSCNFLAAVNTITTTSETLFVNWPPQYSHFDKPCMYVF